MTIKNTSGTSSSTSKKERPLGLRTIMELFDIGPGVAITAIGTAIALLSCAIVYFIHSAPPTTVVISSGPEGSIFQRNANKYAKALERSGVKVKVLTSKGSLENLERLADPKSHVDIGMAQSGLPFNGADKLLSLASISNQPLLLFYRGKELNLVSQLNGKKIAIGAVGSGVRNFALAVLGQNGIKEGQSNTTLLDFDAEQAAKEINAGTIDAAFIMSESASSEILKALMRSKDVHLFNFKQANAYSRKIEHLNILSLPEGAIDLGQNIPPHDVTLLGPMVELVTTKNLHPGFADLILEAAVEVHGRPGIFQHRGDFPKAVEHLIPLSEDSKRYFTSGKTFLYRLLPFWLASLIGRITVVFLPMLVIFIPALRSIPALFRLNVQLKIRRRYRELLALEQELLEETDPEKRNQLRLEFDRIEESVNKMKIRAAFADQVYGLRGHIDYVRRLVAEKSS